MVLMVLSLAGKKILLSAVRRIWRRDVTSWF